MVILQDPSQISHIYDEYKTHPNFFPIIGCVLEGIQTGIVVADAEDSPSNIAVIHAFGFAQLIRSTEDAKCWNFIADLLSSPIVINDQALPKVRFYCASNDMISQVEALPNVSIMSGQRIRYTNISGRDHVDDVNSVQDGDHLLINNDLALDVDSRFWNKASDFYSKGYACLIKRDDLIASVCYSAATSNNVAEIDVATHPSQRNKGLAKKVVLGFIANCHENDIEPVWDCYANNIGSVKTAVSVGFEESYRYDFLIITIKYISIAST